jgi:hypothetical protein
MCEICEGASDDEVLFGIHGRILKFGWAIEYVTGRRVSDCWGYTIGLTQAFGHPELTIAGMGPEPTAEIINSIGRAIRAGTTPSPGELYRCQHREYLLMPVNHRHHREGTFGMWEFYYDHLGETPGEHRVLEIVPRGRRSVFRVAPRRAH